MDTSFDNESLINYMIPILNKTFFENLLYNHSFFTNQTDYVNETQEEYIPYSDRPETYIVPIIFFIIFTVGVLGNGTLVVIFLRHRTMRNVPNT